MCERIIVALKTEHRDAAMLHYEHTPLSDALASLYASVIGIYEDGEVGNDFFAAYERVTTLIGGPRGDAPPDSLCDSQTLGTGVKA